MSELSSLLSWWGWLFALGLFAAPVGAWLFPAAGDRGYLAGKALALVAAGFVPWWLASLGLISFSGTGPILAPLAIAGAGFVAWNFGHRPDWRGIVSGELLFLPFLAVGIAIRAGQPDIFGLEKFMDFGFMNAAMRADTMPPEDMWFAGEPINYYYFGHAMAGLWALITQVPADYGYNLAMGTLFALTAVLTFRLVADALGPDESGRPQMGRVMGGLAAGLVTLGGNGHVILYGLFRDYAGSETGRPTFYFPDSTRFIGYDPATGDKAFTEFPSYGFAVGDMHGHVLALPIVLLALLALAAMIGPGGRHRWAPVGRVPRIRMAHAGLFGALWGISYMTNSWDVAVLGLVALLTAVALVLRAQAPRQAFDRVAAATLVIVVGAVLVAGPFQYHFEPFVQAVCLVGSPAPWERIKDLPSACHPFTQRTPDWQLLVVYGYFLIPVMLAALTPLARPLRRPGLTVAAVFGIAVLLMIVIPELVYVRDFYGPDFARANTMFKLAFRSQMMGVIAACIVLGALARSRNVMGFFASFVQAVPLVAVLTYPGWSLGGRFYHIDNETRPKPQLEEGATAVDEIGHSFRMLVFHGENILAALDAMTLDGLRHLEAPIRDGDRALVALIAKLPLEPGEAILEAEGQSYSYDARISAMTGAPTPLGWFNHEWFWRGKDSLERIGLRRDAVLQLYTSSDTAARCALIARFGIRYVVISGVERDRYGERLAELELLNLGPLLFDDGTTRLIQVGPGGLCAPSP